MNRKWDKPLHEWRYQQFIVADAILVCLDNDGPLSIPELSRELGRNDRWVSEKLWANIRRGYISSTLSKTKTGAEVFYLTNAGHMRAAMLMNRGW